ELEAGRGQRVDHLEQGQRVGGAPVGEPHPPPHLQPPARTADEPPGGGRVHPQVEMVEQVGPHATGHLRLAGHALVHRPQPGRPGGPPPPRARGRGHPPAGAGTPPPPPPAGPGSGGARKCPLTASGSGWPTASSAARATSASRYPPFGRP